MSRSAAAAVSARRSALGAQLLVDRVVAAGGVADRPRRAGIAGRRGQRVVAALAVGQPDRVDRRQVDRRRSRARPAAAAGAERRSGRPRNGGTAHTRSRTARAAGRPGRSAAAAGGPRRGGSGRARSRPRAPRRAPCRAWRSRGSSGRCSSAIACSISAVAAGSSLCSAAACSSTRPSDSSLERSVWPPATLRASSSRQVANWSVQASIVYSPDAGPVDGELGPPSARRRGGRRSARARTRRWCRRERCGARPRAAARGRRGTRRRRPRPCRRRSA